MKNLHGKEEKVCWKLKTDGWRERSPVRPFPSYTNSNPRNEVHSKFPPKQAAHMPNTLAPDPEDQRPSGSDQLVPVPHLHVLWHEGAKLRVLLSGPS